MLEHEKVTQFIADAYYRVALANIDMVQASGVFERLRGAILEGKQLFEVWDVFDEQIGRTEDTHLRSVIYELRVQFIKQATQQILASIMDIAQNDEREGWIAWLQTYAHALSLWRFEICARLCSEPFTLPDNVQKDIEKLRRTTQLLLHERWPETYDSFIFLAQQDCVDKIQRSKFYAVAAEIQLYILMNHDRAKDLLQRAEQLAHDEVRALCGFGRYWLKKKQINKAREFFERAKSISPHSAEGYIGMGDLHAELNEFETAESCYYDAIRVESGNSNAHLSIMDLYGRPELFKTYEFLLPSIVADISAINPQDQYTAYEKLGKAYGENGMYNKALEWFQKAIDLDPLRLSGYITRGFNAMKNADYDLAASSFKEALKVAPEAFDGYWGTAWLNDQQGKWDEALRWYEKCLSYRKEWQQTISTRMAEIKWRRLGDYQKAEEQLFELLRDEPEAEESLGALERLACHYYEERKEVDEASRIYDEIYKIKGKSYKARHSNQIGNMKYYYNLIEEALAAYSEAVALEPDNAVYHRNLAGGFRKLKIWEKAEHEIKMAFELDKKEDMYHDEMALLLNAKGNEYYSQGNYVEAVEEYRRAIEFDPIDPVIYSNLAMAWENVKESGRRLEALDSAIKALKRANNIIPKEEYSKDIERLSRKKEIAESLGEKALDLFPAVTPIAIEVAANLIPYVEGGKESKLSDELERHTREMRQRILDQLGVKIPGIRYRGNETDLPDGSYIIMIMEVPTIYGNISLKKRFYPGQQNDLSDLGIDSEIAFNPQTGDKGCWVYQNDWKAIEKAELELWDIIEYPVRHLEAVIRKNLSEFVGHQEIMDILEIESVGAYEQLRNSPKKLSTLVCVCKGLVCEEVPITPFTEIYGIFDQHYSENHNLLEIVETIRSLPEVRPKLPGNSKEYSFLQLGKNFETEIEHSIYKKNSHSVLAMEPENCKDALNNVRSKIATNNWMALLVENANLRPFVRKLVELEFPNVPVLSRQELLTDFEDNIGGEIELDESEAWEKHDFGRTAEKVIPGNVPDEKMQSTKFETSCIKEKNSESERLMLKIVVNKAFTEKRANADDMPTKEMYKMMQDGLFYELGIVFPEVCVEIDSSLKINVFRIQLNQLEPLSFVGLKRDEFLVNDTVDRLKLLNIEAREAINPANGSECAIVQEKKGLIDTCKSAGLTTWGPAGFVVLTMASEIRKNAAMFLTMRLTRHMLDLLGTAFPDLVKTALEHYSAEELRLILGDLLDEEISVRDLRSILESLLSITGTTDIDLSKYIVFCPQAVSLCFVSDNKNVDNLHVVDYSNFVRMSLRRYISHKYTRGGNTLVVYLLDPDIEERIRQISMQPFTDEEQKRLKDAFFNEVGNLPPTAQNPVVLTTLDIRKKLRKLIETEFPNLAVLSYQELSPDLNIQPIARISWD